MKDYKKSYNEILAWARKNKARLNGVPIEEVLPELAESDDERIMSRIIDGFKNFSRSASKWNNIPVEEVIAYLEKQKENPKSADSIPSDCTSDVKCEDRWHKVGDSLPDNPREVLCKDEAGNYFIGRYYVGEGWEISNYDDEDKPHHLNPPVSKWIDFPLEKQKDLTTENIYKHSRERMSFWNGQQKEQKPADLSEMMVHTEPYIAPVPTPMVADEHKPAEWSEEEIIYWNTIKDYFFGIPLDDKLKSALDWLKSLRTKVNVNSEKVSANSEKVNVNWSEEVDLEKEIERVVENYNSLANGSKVMKPSGIEIIARHFYELGLNAKEEKNESTR